MAATTASTEYSVPGDSVISQSSSDCTRPLRRAECRDRDAGDALAAADPAKSLVRFGFHADQSDVDAECLRETLPHRVTVFGEMRRFGDDGDVSLFDAEPFLRDAPHRLSEHLERMKLLPASQRVAPLGPDRKIASGWIRPGLTSRPSVIFAVTAALIILATGESVVALFR